jgi:deazaflavin-dependent oxidoreductase (nitroreductase family)
MLRRIFRLAGAVALGTFAWLLFVVVAMRTKSPRLLGVVRRFNRSFTNRLQRPFAGSPGAYASVIQHRGRTSGRSYATPVVPFATDDGFVIVLPYGPDTDWVKNVLAEGSAVLITRGDTHTVDSPEIVALDAMGDIFPPSEQRTHRLFGVEQCLRLRRVEADDLVTATDP